jgi:hypothetical protein
VQALGGLPATSSSVCRWLAAFGVQFWASQETNRIIFKTNDDGMAIVPITIASRVEAHVIVDTGAGLDVFAPSLVQKAGGKPSGQFSGFRATGERIDVPLFIVPEIRTGPLCARTCYFRLRPRTNRIRKRELTRGTLARWGVRVSEFRRLPRHRVGRLRRVHVRW